MNKLLKWRLVVLAIFTTLLGGTFIFKPDADKTGGLVANVKLADIEKPLITKPDKPVVKNKPVVKKTPKKKATKPKTIKSKPDPRIIFTENFSKYSVGDPIPSWGPNLQVLGGRRKYLDSQIAGKHMGGQYVSFPENFSMQFTVMNNHDGDHIDWTHDLPVFLIDSKGGILKIDFTIRIGVKVNISFPEIQKTDAFWAQQAHKIREKQNLFFLITYNSGTAKVYLDGKFMASHYYGNKFGRFKEFQVTVMSREIRYTNFLIKDLSDSPSVQTASVLSNTSTPYTSKPATQTLKERTRAQAERSYVALYKNKITVSGSKFTCRCPKCSQYSARGSTYHMNQFSWGLFAGDHRLQYDNQILEDWLKKTYGISF